MAGTARVLVADDDQVVRATVTAALTGDGFSVTEVGDGPAVLSELRSRPPDVVVLDIEMPGMSGLEVLKDVREHSGAPVILLTSRTSELDRVLGLELGADDYVVKPFSPRELTARVRALLRRTGAVSPEIVMVGDIEVDLGARRVRKDGDEIVLTRREFDLLAHLARHPGRALSRDELLAEVWGSSTEWQDPSTVTEHIRRLRTKLGDDTTAPTHLIAVRGVGYRLDR